MQKAKEEVEAIANAPAPEAAATEETAEAPKAASPAPAAQEKPAGDEEVDIDLNDPDVLEAATKIQVCDEEYMFSL